MTPYEIPLIAQPQQFNITLNGKQYQMRVTWCPPSACWILDLADNAGAPLVSGIPLVTGVDLLAQYEYLGIGGALIVQTDSEPDTVPSYAALGTTGHLFFVVEP